MSQDALGTLQMARGVTSPDLSIASVPRTYETVFSGVLGAVDSFQYRNPGFLADPRASRDTVHAMDAARKEFPWCAWCSQEDDGVEVHHIFPVLAFPQRACDPDNLICLCRKCHFTIGHFCNYKMYNPMVREMCEQKQLCWSI